MKDTGKNKILFIAPQPYFVVRGSVIRVNQNIISLSNLGHTIDLLTLPFGNDKKIPGVNIIRTPNPLNYKNIKIGPSFRKLVFDILLLVVGLNLIRKNNYSIIHGVEDGGIVSLFLSAFTKSKIIYEKHSDTSSYQKSGFLKLILRIFTLLEKATICRSAAVICTGQGTLDQVKNICSRAYAVSIHDIASSQKIPNSYEVAEMRKSITECDKEILLTFVGSFAEYQGIELLINTIKEVSKSDINARFIIIGGSSKEINALKSVLDDNILNIIHFYGKTDPDTVATILSASDILLSPRTGGVNSPLKLIDYMKAGKPIIATDIPANSQILNCSVSIMIPADSIKMANTVISLASNSRKQHELGAQALKLYESKYKLSIFNSKIKDVYDNVLNRNN